MKNEVHERFKNRFSCVLQQIYFLTFFFFSNLLFYYSVLFLFNRIANIDQKPVRTLNTNSMQKCRKIPVAPLIYRIVILITDISYL